MKIELIVFAVTAFFVANSYYDGKYMAYLKKGEKYYKMAGIAFAGLSTYLFIRKNPEQTGDLLTSAAGVMRQLPVDNGPLSNYLPKPKVQRELPRARVQAAGGSEGRMKRSVSETKKKYVASAQSWRCGDCGDKLSAWFEIDHAIRLDRGGSNEVENLVALCRNCHGKKTAMENM